MFDLRPLSIGYLTNYSLAESPSTALRIAGVAQALAIAGNRVTIISGDVDAASLASRYETLKDPRIDLRGTAIIKSASGRRDAMARLLRGDNEMGDLARALDFDNVIGYGTQSGLVRQARKAMRTSTQVTLDVTEWYQPSHLARARQPHYALEHEISMRRHATRIPRLLVISSYLENYFTRHGVACLRVPPLFDPGIRQRSSPFRADDSLTHITVAGVVGGKDLQTIRNVLLGAQEVNMKRRRVVVHIVGSSEVQVRSTRGIPASSLRGVQFHGRVSHSESLRIVESSDFTAVHRPARRRYAKAGFPSKVVESWMVGTPVITNLSSDLNRYALDGQNALVLVGEDPGAFASGLERALASTHPFNRESIAKWAESEFSPSIWANSIDRFLRAGA